MTEDLKTTIKTLYTAATVTLGVVREHDNGKAEKALVPFVRTLEKVLEATHNGSLTKLQLHLAIAPLETRVYPAVATPGSPYHANAKNLRTLGRQVMELADKERLE